MRFLAAVTLISLILCNTAVANDGYLMIEGNVKAITGNYLIIVDSRDKTQKEQHFPLSAFTQVFDIKGQLLKLSSFTGAGYITMARIYVLYGKVEKIQVMEMQQ